MCEHGTIYLGETGAYRSCHAEDGLLRPMSQPSEPGVKGGKNPEEPIIISGEKTMDGIITRNIASTIAEFRTIKGTTVAKESNTITVPGELSRADALSFILEMMPDIDSAIITGMRVERTKYTMKIEDFIKYASTNKEEK